MRVARDATSKTRVHEGGLSLTRVYDEAERVAAVLPRLRFNLQAAKGC